MFKVSGHRLAYQVEAPEERVNCCEGGECLCVAADYFKKLKLLTRLVAVFLCFGRTNLAKFIPNNCNECSERKSGKSWEPHSENTARW